MDGYGALFGPSIGLGAILLTWWWFTSPKVAELRRDIWWTLVGLVLVAGGIGAVWQLLKYGHIA